VLLTIHHLRKSDIHLLHKEYYFSCMSESEDDQAGAQHGASYEDEHSSVVSGVDSKLN
jgi:hypothetical protein